MAKKPALERKEKAKAGKGIDPAFAYSALPGVADEMVDNTGAVRPVWQNLLGALSHMSEKELHARFARADRYLRDAGVFYRAYGAKGASERSWPISHIPVLIDEREWEKLSEGLVQRADLLERIMADIHGENRLVNEGFIPPALIAANPEFLR